MRPKDTVILYVCIALVTFVIGTAFYQQLGAVSYGMFILSIIFSTHAFTTWREELSSTTV